MVCAFDDIAFDSVAFDTCGVVPPTPGVGGGVSFYDTRPILDSDDEEAILAWYAMEEM